MLNLIPAHENPFELLFVVFGYGYVMLHEVFQCHDVGSFCLELSFDDEHEFICHGHAVRSPRVFLNPEFALIGQVTVLLAESQSEHFAPSP